MDYQLNPGLLDFLERAKRRGQGLPDEVAAPPPSDLAEGLGPKEGEVQAAVGGEMQMPELDLTDGTHGASIARPAVDTPPEAAVAQATPLPDVPAQPNAPEEGPETPPAEPKVMPPPQAPANGDSARTLRDVPVEGAPSFYSQAADMARQMAHKQDFDNRNRWQLGEGLKQAMAIARGQSYSPQAYAEPSEEAFVEKGQQDQRQQLAQWLAQKRQATEDAIGNRLKESEISKNLAETDKAKRPPEMKPTDFNAADAKAAMKSSPGMVEAIKHKKGFKTDAEVSDFIDKLPNTKDAFELAAKDIENEAQGKRAEGRGITLAVTSSKLGLETDPEKRANAVLEDAAKKQNTERFNIGTARRQVDQVWNAFSEIPGSEIAAAKFNIHSPGYAEFMAATQGLVDKYSAVETGGAARQGAINAWTKVIEDPSAVTNGQMAGIIRGLRGGLDAAETENERRTEGFKNADIVAPKPVPRPGEEGNHVSVQIINHKTGETGTLHGANEEEVRKLLKEAAKEGFVIQ